MNSNQEVLLRELLKNNASYEQWFAVLVTMIVAGGAAFFYAYLRKVASFDLSTADPMERRPNLPTRWLA